MRTFRPQLLPLGLEFGMPRPGCHPRQGRLPLSVLRLGCHTGTWLTPESLTPEINLLAGNSAGAARAGFG